MIVLVGVACLLIGFYVGLALHAALVKAKEDDAWVEGWLRAQRDKRRAS